MVDTLRIVGIVGMLEPATPCFGLWEYFETAFKEVYPEAEFVVKRLRYLPFEGKKIRTYAEGILEEYDDGKPTMLFGYSMGGVVAAALEPRFIKTKISKVVTVFSPHTFLRGKFSQMCGSALLKTQTPIISVRARFDVVVPWGSKHPHASRHLVLNCDHLFGLNRKVALKIAEASVL